MTFLLLGSVAGTLLGFLMGFLSLFLILLILIQRGKGGGLTGALGGPGGQSAFGSKAGDTFTVITVVVAAVWGFTCAFTMWLLGTHAPTPLAESAVTAGPGDESAQMGDEFVIPKLNEDIDAGVGSGSGVGGISDGGDTLVPAETSEPETSEPGTTEPEAAGEESAEEETE